MRKQLIIFITLLSVSFATTTTAYPGIKDLFKKNKETTVVVHPDLPTLTVDENLLIPELDKKQKTQARKIQKLEAERLQKTDGLNVELIRDEEVIHVTIAASLYSATD